MFPTETAITARRLRREPIIDVGREPRRNRVAVPQCIFVPFAASGVSLRRRRPLKPDRLTRSGRSGAAESRWGRRSCLWRCSRTGLGAVQWSFCGTGWHLVATTQLAVHRRFLAGSLAVAEGFEPNQLPGQRHKMPSSCVITLITEEARTACLRRPRSLESSRGALVEFEQVLAHAGGHLLDPQPFCAGQGQGAAEFDHVGVGQRIDVGPR
jgi:hypothetical protein